MKKQIRKGLFETNSSSVHALCIPKNEPYTLPNEVIFQVGEYGWGPDEEYNTANYLYTTLLYLEMNDKLRELKEILAKHGVTSVFKKPRNDDWYVDHSGCYDPDHNFLEDIFKDEDKLLRYLFCPSSYILIFNDNMSTDEYWKELEHKEQDENWEIYEKWN